MPRSNTLALALAAGLILSSTALAADKAPKSVDLPPSSQALSSYTKIANKVAAPAPGALVHIPTFRVEVVRELEKSADTRGLGGNGPAHQTSRWLLEEVNEAELQALTQALYDELVADLKSRGYRVATPEETAADPDVGPLMAGRPSGARMPSKDGVSSFYAPAGLQVVMMPMDLRAPTQRGVAGSLAAVGSMSGAIGRMTAATKAASRGELVLEPKFTIGFADLSSSTEGFGGRFANTASVSGKAGLRIVEEGTRIDAIEPKGRDVTTNSAHLTNPLTLAGGLGGVRNATTNSQRAGAVAGAVIGLLSGSGSAVGMSSRAVSATESFAPTSQAGLSVTQKALLQRLLAGS